MSHCTPPSTTIRKRLKKKRFKGEKKERNKSFLESSKENPYSFILRA
jgi:hypothetical protein